MTTPDYEDGAESATDDGTGSGASPQDSEAPSPLLESAYDFVEHALAEADAAEDLDGRRWKFAIIDIATAVELFAKERLRREHPVLIYTRVEEGAGHTVSLEVALKRLQACRVPIDRDDVVRLGRARDLRNAIMHFNTKASPEQLREAFVDLFEFAHSFHAKELGEELHECIGPEYWAAEAAFIESFRREFVHYHGEDVHREWPAVLVEAQYYTHWIIDGTPYARIPYGDIREGWDTSPVIPCHDCAALPGQLHADGCDCDRCPRCGGQTLLGCDCAEAMELASWPIQTEGAGSPSDSTNASDEKT